MSTIHARAWVFGDDVDTDLIYHNKYLAETDPKNMPQYAFEYYPGKENFAKEVKPGDIVVAVYCLQYADIPCVLAETCSRIYYRNAINNGYPVLFVKGISDAIKNGDIKDGDMLDVDMGSGKIVNIANGKTFHGDAVSDLEHDIMEAGGLFQYMKKSAKA